MLLIYLAREIISHRDGLLPSPSWRHKDRCSGITLVRRLAAIPELKVKRVAQGSNLILDTFLVELNIIYLGLIQTQDCRLSYRENLVRQTFD
jgi:hypothetical protein